MYDYPDYIDDKMADAFAEVMHNRTKSAKTSGKNKHLEWTTRQGEIIRLCDMEDSQLANTIVYIHKRLMQYEDAAFCVKDRGFTIPPFIINKRPALEWLDIMGKEASRREAKRIAEAKKVLGHEQT